MLCNLLYSWLLELFPFLHWDASQTVITLSITDWLKSQTFIKRNSISGSVDCNFCSAESVQSISIIKKFSPDTPAVVYRFDKEKRNVFSFIFATHNANEFIITERAINGKFIH